MTIAFIKAAENFWHSLVQDSQKVVLDDLGPVLTFIETKGPSVLAMAVTIIAGGSATAPWASLIAALIPVAEAAGVKLAEDEASIFLNLAKANLLAQGK